MSKITLILRAETKTFEKRTPLTPMGARKIISLGHKVFVESSEMRIFKDEMYAEVGCELVTPGFWKSAPITSFILGLKELEEESFPLSHRHIYFAHAYKGQEGADKILDRFIQGGGKLYDLEFLLDENNRRVAAFGAWAGFAGAAMAVFAWIQREKKSSLNKVSPIGDFSDQDELVKYLKEELDVLGHLPRAIVIGHRGRCGSGAVRLFEMLNIQTVKWGSKETKDKGPFKEILDYEILVNSVYLREKIAPFLTREFLATEEKHLQVISDVSCDPNGPHNPLPIYSECTTFRSPCLQIANDVELIAIDNLPTLLPKESSEDFEAQLLPHLRQILAGEIEGTVWEKSLEYFFETTMEMGLEYTPNYNNLQVTNNLLM